MQFNTLPSNVPEDPPYLTDWPYSDGNATAPMNTPDTGNLPLDPPESRDAFSSNFGVKDIGMSVPLGISAGNVEGVSAKIRSGIKNFELGFAGTVHGNRQAQTPEMYGKEQRQALRELAKVNDVNFTTHAAYGVMGMMGTDQQGNTSLDRGAQALHEVQRAVEFAKDVAGGGSVVVHTGEFERPVSHIYPTGVIMNDDGTKNKNYATDEQNRIRFKKRITEPGDYGFLLIDDRTGQGFSTVQADRNVAQPVWLRAKKDYEYVVEDENDPSGKPIGTKVKVNGPKYDRNGKIIYQGDYIDYENKLIRDPYDIEFERRYYETGEKKTRGRVPEFDPKSGRFKTRLMSHDDFEYEAQEYNKYYKDLMGKGPDYWDRATGREMFLKSTLMTQAGHSRGWALNYGERLDQQFEKLKKLQKIKDFYEKLDKDMPEDEKWRIMKQDDELYRVSKGLIPTETKHPLKMIEEAMTEARKYIEFASQASSSQEMQAEDTIESMRHLRTPEKYIEKHNAKYYAMAGIKAMDETVDKKKPLVITMENIFPERYGGHPEELSYLIKQARRKMVELLTTDKLEDTGRYRDDLKNPQDKQYDWGPFKPGENEYYTPGLSKKEAEKLAQTHIKATIDTGHLNMWRKFFVQDRAKSKEQNQKEFDKWMVTEIEKMAKQGLIGNIHLTDNFGYQDDHLAPGQGNVPIKEILSVLEKHGYKDAITVEPGADATTDQGDVHGVLKTWRMLGSPVYGSTGPVRMGAPQDTWTNVQHSYFGRGYSPYFTFGAYSPSNDWTLWSGVPME